ncbi:MAG: response regulator [Leptolyngbyaceae cyanobacterium SL_7_1]|nr:response regulator [Leptolyngbyaceae cyanobacterium SL_7_1]
MSATSNPRRDRILVVDDIPDNLFLIKAILDDEGYEIQLVSDGIAALDQINQTPPDLVLLDIMMPGMDGYEVSGRIRQSTKLPYIPILLITAHGESSLVRGLDSGADDFIRKPLDVDELLARVRSLLRLKHTIDERDAIARQREDFISRLTHDLRTPLVAADRMLNLMRQEAFCPISPEMTEAIDAIVRSNKNLLQMVNTLLEVHRHEAGNKVLTVAPCDLKTVIQDVAQELAPLAEEKGLSLNLHLQDNGDSQTGVVMGDRLELRRVITNLIGNAIKFTDSGWIDIHLSTSDNQTPPQWVVIEVKDTGPGIPPDDRLILFERFRQGNHKRAGSGLGLHLSRRIVEAHEGTIAVNSEMGKGSAFTIRIPKKP